MKKILVILLLCSAVGMWAQSLVNLTPRPKQMAEGQGSFLLPSHLVVAYGSLPDSLSREAARFVSDLNAATGLQASAQSSSEGAIRMQLVTDCSPEGYRLAVTTEGVKVEASTSAGFFYAFQSLKKMLPANVMARKYDARRKYTLPVVTIADEPGILPTTKVGVLKSRNILV